MSDEKHRSLGRRLLWFLLLWAGGVAALGLVSLLIRSVLHA
jgi:hypothetical protein